MKKIVLLSFWRSHLCFKEKRSWDHCSLHSAWNQIFVTFMRSSVSSCLVYLYINVNFSSNLYILSLSKLFFSFFSNTQAHKLICYFKDCTELHSQGSAWSVYLVFFLISIIGHTLYHVNCPESRCPLYLSDDTYLTCISNLSPTSFFFPLSLSLSRLFSFFIFLTIAARNSSQK